MLNAVLHKLGIPEPITTKQNYLKFLELTGKIAFELSKRKNPPLQLLENLKDVVDDLPLQNRNTVLEAFNTFLDHEETVLWLNSFTGDGARDIDTILT